MVVERFEIYGYYVVEKVWKDSPGKVINYVHCRILNYLA